MAQATSSIDYGMFTTISIIDSWKVRYPVPALIRDTFFPVREFSDAEEVRIDSMLGGKQLAPFVLPLENQVVGRRRPFKSVSIPAPIIAPARVITPRELRGPQMGETPYNYKSPVERFATLLASDGEDMDDEIARREEWMCCQCMFKGQIPINYRNKTNIIIDYGFTNTVILTKPWTDPTSDPFEDLRKVQGSLNANGYAGDVCVYSPSAWEALWKNPNVQDKIRNTFPGWIPISGLPGTTQISFAGVQQGPRFLSPPMENWIYYATYAQSNAADPSITDGIPYIPDGCVAVGSRDIKNAIWYGVVIQMEQADEQYHYYSTDRVPKLESNVNKNLHMQTITSRPVPVPFDLLSWAVIEGTV
jgi:hypothetical protein